MQDLSLQLSHIFTQMGASPNCGVITLSGRPDLADYQCNGALMAAKDLKKAPLLIAQEVISKINNPLYTLEAVAPGFINIKLNPTALLNPIVITKTSNPLKVVIDYASPNVAKGMHVGHLRSTLIGQALINLYKFLGHEVTADNHLGDWGTPLGIVISMINKEKPAELTLPIIENLYIQGSILYKTDETFKSQVQETTMKMQSGDIALKSLWQTVVDITKKDLLEDFSTLKVKFDTWLGESFFEPMIEPMIESLENKNLVKNSMGAKVMSLKSDPPLILQKTSGAYLYHTTDLACLKYRQSLFEKVLYVVDKRQGLHFNQVFEAAEIAGFLPSHKAEHVAFGTINGADGKPFKTRSGEVLKLKELIKEVQVACLEKLETLNSNYSQEEKVNISLEVGLGALKFAELKHHRLSDYIFDLEKFLSLEGFTGPYVLYSGVRMKSILSKVEGSPILDKNHALSPTEKTLLIKLHQFNDILHKSIKDNEPHQLCLFSYEIAKEFNHFYQEVNISKESNEKLKSHYLWLTQESLKVLSDCLSILGISIPLKM